MKIYNYRLNRNVPKLVGFIYQEDLRIRNLAKASEARKMRVVMDDRNIQYLKGLVLSRCAWVFAEVVYALGDELSMMQ